MILTQHMTEVLSRWEGADIRRRSRRVAVWDIGEGPGLLSRNRRQRRLAIAACRRELLDSLLEDQRPVFLRHAPPEDYDVPGQWQRAGDCTWLVPPDLNLDDRATEYWLFSLGNWTLYRAPAPADEVWPVDAFRCTAPELLSWMRVKSIQVLIDSFHDDTGWVVALDAA